MLRIAFRVDGGPNIGMGHISECLALAEELQSNTDANILFITRKCEEIPEILRNYQVRYLSEKCPKGELGEVNRFISRFSPHVLILDITDPYPTIKRSPHFLEWVKNQRKREIFVVGIEGISTKNYCPDIIFNGTIVPEWHDYPSNPQTRYYIGPKYVILSKEFKDANQKERVISDRPETVLICMGGSDKPNMSAKTTSALRRLECEVEITVIVGPWYKGRPILNGIIRDHPQKIRVCQTVEDMCKHIMNSQIAITSAGKILYELCATGTPSISIPIAKHQLHTAKEMERQKTTITLGFGVSEVKIEKSTEMLLRNKNVRKCMSDHGKELVDGRGSERISKIILRSLGEIS